jgi:hypothetical protein
MCVHIYMPGGHQWLTPVILATQEDCGLKPAQSNTSMTPCLEKTHHKKGLVE